MRRLKIETETTTEMRPVQVEKKSYVLTLSAKELAGVRACVAACRSFAGPEDRVTLFAVIRDIAVVADNDEAKNPALLSHLRSHMMRRLGP